MNASIGLRFMFAAVALSIGLAACAPTPASPSEQLGANSDSGGPPSSSTTPAASRAPFDTQEQGVASSSEGTILRQTVPSALPGELSPSPAPPGQEEKDRYGYNEGTPKLDDFWQIHGVGYAEWMYLSWEPATMRELAEASSLMVLGDIEISEGELGGAQPTTRITLLPTRSTGTLEPIVFEWPREGKYRWQYIAERWPTGQYLFFLRSGHPEPLAPSGDECAVENICAIGVVEGHLTNLLYPKNSRSDFAAYADLDQAFSNLEPVIGTKSRWGS